MPTPAERLETAIALLESLVANTTGTGDMVLKTSPTLVTPTLGVASATSLTTSGNVTVGTGTANWVFTTTTFTQSNSSGVQVLRALSTGRVISQGGFDATNNETNQQFSIRYGSIIGYDESNVITFSVSSTTGIISAGVWQATVISPAYGGTGVNNGSYTITLGGNVTLGGLFATVGTFSTGGNFSTGGAVSTGGTFTTVGNFTAGGDFTTSHAFTTTGGAVTLTVTGTTNVTLPTSGTLATTAEGTSTTPGLNRQWLRSGTIQLVNLTEVKAGTGSSTSSTPVSFNLVSGTTSTTGFGGRRAAPSNNGVFFEGKSAGVIPWATKTVEGEVLLVFVSGWDTGSVFRLHIGRTNAQSTGNTAHASHPDSFEIRYEPSTALKVIGATGSATTSVTSSFTPTLGTAFRLRWKVSGGTIIVWVNGTQVATNAGGPTTDSGVTANVFYMGVENSGTVTTGSEVKTSIPVLDIY